MDVSQNHKTAWFGRDLDLKSHLVPIFCPATSITYKIKLLKALSNLDLNIFSAGTSTASPGSLCLCLTSPSVSNFSLTSKPTLFYDKTVDPYPITIHLLTQRKTPLPLLPYLSLLKMSPLTTVFQFCYSSHQISVIAVRSQFSNWTMIFSSFCLFTVLLELVQRHCSWAVSCITFLEYLPNSLWTIHRFISVASGPSLSLRSSKAPFPHQIQLKALLITFDILPHLISCFPTGIKLPGLLKV